MEKEIMIVIAIVAVLGSIVFAVSKDLKKVAQVMSGWGLYQFFGIFYDYLLWGFIQYKFGILGSVGLSIGALAINLFLLRWYIRKKVDWLGVKILEDIKRDGYKWINKVLKYESRVARGFMYVPVKLFDFLLDILNKNDIFAFFFLSIWQDPFITTAFLRHGKTGAIKRRDYSILLASTVVTSLYWTVFIGIILQIIKVVIF